MKKIVKIIFIVTMLLILNSLNILNSVNAANITNMHVYSAGDCGSLLNYKGVTVITTYAEYANGGNKYPAYCLNNTLQGVGAVADYDVNASQMVTDVKLWRLVINGYPYKTIEQLGVANAKEAFTATKHAIYCYIHGNDINQYTAIGEAGTRTLNAMKKIVENANNSKETKISSLITINNNLEKWQQEGQYLVKHYSVTSKASMNKYTIKIGKANNELPEGIKIVNEKNEEKQEFNNGEKFKVIIPIQNLKKEGNFKLLVSGKINTKPVLYGRAYNSNYQDYALTGVTYEDGTGEVIDNYDKNKTKIIIDKKDGETGEKLQGTEFELLNNKKEVVYNNLVTNENGKVTIEGVVPGEYFLRETKPKAGYIKYSDLISVKVKYNQELTITVSNSKEDKPKFEYTKDSQNVEVEKLPVTGM